ncbi:MAG TPA: Ig-like domain-containing protein [Sphingomicrobium sp.]|nr:Ig-like domain-containing protein [Sphingomicrobium sp.]
MSFTISGLPGVQVTATESAGSIEFKLDVIDSDLSSGDLRALFFHIAESELSGLSISSTSPLLADWRVGANSIIDLDDGANLRGAVHQGFDVGLKWGSPGGSPDDVNFPLSFTLSNTTGDLTLDDVGGMLFGARLDSVGGRGGHKDSASKLLAEAPYAPDAIDDIFSIHEDGAADSSSASKSPAAVTFDVLHNDTDVDSAVSAFYIDAIVEDALHGNVEISDDGTLVYYTPDLDYSGTDSFWYCMTDGSGGMDSAMCTINIAAVADDAVFAIDISQGTTINETLVTVTATQNDADGSEVISSLDWSSALPAGATVTPAGPIAGGGDQVTQQFVVTAAAGADWNFNVDFRAVSMEVSNGDLEDNVESKSFVGNFEHSAQGLTYAVTDQSIWDSGDAFHYDLSGDDGFFGVKIPETHDDITLEVPVVGTDIASVSWGYGLTAGIQVDFHLDGGGIDASVPVDVTVDSTYNRTTDVIYIDSSMALGSGGSFETTGPEGHLKIDAILNYLLEAHIGGFTVPDADFGPYELDKDWSIVDLDTSDPAYSLPIIPGLELTAEWPHISVENDPGTLSGSGFSNNMLALNLDIDQIISNIFFGGANPLDSDPATEDNFEVADLDLVGGLRLFQEFAVGLNSGQTVDLVLEDNTVVPLTIGTGLWINEASSHDADHNGVVTFSFGLDPDVQLTNSTSIDINLSAQAAVLRNIPLVDYTVWSDDNIDIAHVPIEVYNNSFALNGVGSQDVNFFV